jgi:hypothetical protein
VWAVLKKNDKLLRPLGGLILSIGALNACAEKWATIKRLPFEWTAAILLLFFVLPYRSVCLRLIERTGLKASFVKEQYAALPFIYVGLAAIFFVAFHSAQDENPPLALFAFVTFICVVHVPTFAYGTHHVKEFVVRSGIVASQPPVNISWRFIATVTGMLGMPVILAILFEAVPFDDYRLASVDVVITVVIISLFSSRGRSSSVGVKSAARYSGNRARLSRRRSVSLPYR